MHCSITADISGALTPNERGLTDWNLPVRLTVPTSGESDGIKTDRNDGKIEKLREQITVLENLNYTLICVLYCW